MRGLILLLLALAASSAWAADSGEALYQAQCSGCHALSGASTSNGPSLKGVIWRKIATLPDFDYSGALKAKLGSWSPARLDTFLADTQGFAPGTGMYFAIQDPAQRRAIIDYLKTAP